MEFSLDNLIGWLNSHPHLILFTIALLALLESLAIVGILVPGVALLMAAATAAGSADVDVWQMLLAGFVGAVIGDGVSFLLGYHYHPVIRQIPPFKSHPEWIEKGERFFQRYGLLGIVLGRFIGPIRPVMPLVAGFMEMPPRKFFTINVLSAVAWSPFYLMPGYLVGQSLEGPGALEGRHLGFLLGLFLGGWLLAQFGQRLHAAMHVRRIKLQLTLSLGGVFLSLLLVLGFTVQTGALQSLNTASAQWLFALRHHWLDDFFIGLTVLGEFSPMVVWAALVTFALLLQRNFYAAGLWVSFTLLGKLLMHGGKYGFAVARPELVTQPPDSFAYPSGHTAMMVVFCGLLASLLLPSVNARRHALILSCVAVLVMFVAAARLYLGVHWVTDIIGGLLLGGFILCLFYAVVLRWPFHRIRPVPLLIACALAWLINIAVFVLPQYSQWAARYLPFAHP